MTHPPFHPAGDSFEWYVTGALPPEQASALERHTVECATCAARLAREARVEAALFEAAGQLTSRVAHRAARRTLLRRLAPAIAAAAAFAVLKLSWHPRRTEAPRRQVVAARDLLDARMDAIALDDLDAPMDRPEARALVDDDQRMVGP